MDLKYLIDQLEAELIAQTRQQQLADAAELAEGETARITLMQRLSAALGKEITIYRPGGQPQQVLLEEVGNGWILVRNGRETELINLKNCPLVGGLKDARIQVLEVQKRSQINQIMRRIARGRLRVLVTLADGTFQTGYLVSVYADHFDLLNEQNRHLQLSVASNGLFSLKTLGA